MKKSDIKNGMHLITNSGDEYVVMSNVSARDQTTLEDKMILICLSHGWMTLEDYDDDLRCHDDGNYIGYDCFNIKEVYIPKYYSCVLDSVKKDKESFIKLWEYTKKMTKEEIEKELGYKIEIVE